MVGRTRRRGYEGNGSGVVGGTVEPTLPPLDQQTVVGGRGRRSSIAIKATLSPSRIATTAIP